jgi:hypothetical protein
MPRNSFPDKEVQMRSSKVVGLFLACIAIALTGRALGDSTSVDMNAGVAKAVITPDVPLVITNGPVATGKIADLYARALVLNDGKERLAILTYDLNCLDRATAECASDSPRAFPRNFSACLKRSL